MVASGRRMVASGDGGVGVPRGRRDGRGSLPARAACPRWEQHRERGETAGPPCYSVWGGYAARVDRFEDLRSLNEEDWWSIVGMIIGVGSCIVLPIAWLIYGALDYYLF